MTIIILIISLLLALGAGYLFLGGGTVSIKDKLVAIVTEYGETEADIKTFKTNMDAGDPAGIKQGKTDNETRIAAKQTELKTATDKNRANIQKKLDCLQEMQNIFQSVEKKEDFDKQVGGYGDYAYAGGIVVVVFGLSFGLLKVLFGTTKTGNE